MIRMVLGNGLSSCGVSAAVGALGPDDLASIQALYADEPPAFFLPSMLGNGVYYGAWESERLVAVAGTHVVAQEVSVAALGNIYTRGDRRGRGLATAVTSAVARALVRMNIATIVLNVREDNQPAVRVYERLGFTRYCGYFEVVASRP
jgi:ribosomal protein S18 acetylase RimI-like enzyme